MAPHLLECPAFYGKSIISLGKIANQMRHDHLFSQINKTTERAVGVGQNLKKGGE